jgi:hypothetical protein
LLKAANFDPTMWRFRIVPPIDRDRFESYMPSQPESSRARLCMNPDTSGG